MTVEREERKSTNTVNQKKEENFCLTYDSDQEVKARKMQNILSHAKSLKLKQNNNNNRLQDQ